MTHEIRRNKQPSLEPKRLSTSNGRSGTCGPDRGPEKTDSAENRGSGSMVEKEQQDATALMSEAIKNPTLDDIMRGWPDTISYPELVGALRVDRSRFIAAQKVKSDKVEEDDG